MVENEKLTNEYFFKKYSHISVTKETQAMITVTYFTLKFTIKATYHFCESVVTDTLIQC